ncbi:MAG: histidinol-phosphatase [Rikenellaceae bacterium]
MMKIKLTIIALFFLLISSTSSAQEIRKNEFRLPDEILGFKVLKCDFHMHTIFSDGMVWPIVRVDEAVAEGLDAISITDHIEFRPRLKEMGAGDSTSMNIAYRLATRAAVAAGIILIPGVEITKEVPPGHFNALFVKDADAFAKHMNPKNPRDGSYIRAALQEAQNQGAFIFWNHPWYQTQNNESIWFPVIDSLYKEGYIKGIEVVNATKYDPVILGWVQSKNLTNIANTDAHSPINLREGEHRTMTIVFAKERTSESIHEALKEKRSISYCNDHLYGDKKYLEEIFHKSIVIETTHDISNNGYLTILNNSSIPFSIKFIDTKNLQFKTFSGGITVPMKGETAVKFINNNEFKKGEEILVSVEVENLEVAPDKGLSTVLILKFN